MPFHCGLYQSSLYKVGKHTIMSNEAHITLKTPVYISSVATQRPNFRQQISAQISGLVNPPTHNPLPLWKLFHLEDWLFEKLAIGSLNN